MHTESPTVPELPTVSPIGRKLLEALHNLRCGHWRRLAESDDDQRALRYAVRGDEVPLDVLVTRVTWPEIGKSGTYSSAEWLRTVAELNRLQRAGLVSIEKRRVNDDAVVSRDEAEVDWCRLTELGGRELGLTGGESGTVGPGPAVATASEGCLPPRALKAGEQFRQAAEALGVHKPTDRQAYDQLRDATEKSGEASELPEFDTWQRNLREYRRLTGQQKHVPRAGRARAAGSVVSADQLEPGQLPTRVRPDAVRRDAED